MRLRLFFACFILFVGLAAMADDSTQGVISTIVGNGTEGSGGDGGPATLAQVNGSVALAVDSAGNLYIADAFARAIRKVGPDGVIRTVLGASGGLGYPVDVAVDAAGNLYIGDVKEYGFRGRVIRMTPAGAVSTIGNEIFARDGYPAAVTTDSMGNVYFANGAFNFVDLLIYKVSPDGTLSVAGPSQENLQGGLAADSAGNIYTASDVGVWKLDPQGKVTGVPSCPCCPASDVAVDRAGNLFVADGDARVCMVTPAGKVTTIAGNGTQGFSGDGGPATSAQLNQPTSVAVDNSGNLLIGDSGNRRIRKVTFAANSEIFFSQVAVGGGYHTTFALSNIGDSAISGNLVLTDQQGQPLTANGNDAGSGSSFPVSIAPAGTIFLTLNPLNPNDSVKSGWARLVTAGGVLHGVATFHLASGETLQTVAGVLPSQPIQHATISVDDDYSQGRLTGYALANPSNQNLVIKLALVDQDGKVVEDTVTFTLAPKQQVARYLYQDLARQQFKGSMVLRAQGGGSFVVVALAQYQKLFTVIPVIPGKAPSVPD